MGIDDEIGSIEDGKKANLFVSTGEPCESTPKTLDVFIDGFQVPIPTFQIEMSD